MIALLVQPRNGWYAKSGQEFRDDAAGDVGEAVLAALKFESQLFVIKADEVQQRRVEVVDMDGILDDGVAEVVCFADGDAGLGAAAGHPDAEGIYVMIAPRFGGGVVVSI